MGRDAVRDLRAWQREAAGVQEQALRAATKAHRRIEELDTLRVAAIETLVVALEELATTGVSRDQAAVFLGVEMGSLPTRRPKARGAGSGPELGTQP
jgi:hypothetical protein